MSHFLIAGRTEPIEAVWYLNNQAVAGSAVVEFTRYNGGIKEWWDGAAWSALQVTFPMTGFDPARYTLDEVPVEWIAEQITLTATHSTQGEHVVDVVTVDPAALEAGSDTADFGGYTQ